MRRTVGDADESLVRGFAHGTIAALLPLANLYLMVFKPT
jgi:hypothetical protein